MILYFSLGRDVGIKCAMEVLNDYGHSSIYDASNGVTVPAHHVLLHILIQAGLSDLEVILGRCAATKQASLAPHGTRRMLDVLSGVVESFFVAFIPGQSPAINSGCGDLVVILVEQVFKFSHWNPQRLVWQDLVLQLGVVWMHDDVVADRATVVLGTTTEVYVPGSVAQNDKR